MADAALEAPLAAGRSGSSLQGRDSRCRRRRRRRASSCAGAEAVRVACGMVFGAEPPSQLGPAGEGDEARGAVARPGRMAVDRGRRRRRGDRRRARSRCSREPPTASSTSRIARSASSPAGRPRRASSTPAARSISSLKAFPVGFATRTLFDKAEIVLWRRAEATFHIEVWRSFAPYLAASLAEAARGAPEW